MNNKKITALTEATLKFLNETSDTSLYETIEERKNELYVKNEYIEGDNVQEVFDFANSKKYNLIIDNSILNGNKRSVHIPNIKNLKFHNGSISYLNLTKGNLNIFEINGTDAGYNVYFDELKIKHLEFKNVKLNTAMLEKCVIDSVVMVNTMVPQEFKNCTFKFATIYKSTFMNSFIENCKISNLTVKNSDLMVRFIGGEVSASDFTNIKKGGIILTNNVVLKKCIFTNLDWFYLNFEGKSTLDGCTFKNVDFSEISGINNATFKNTKFINCKFRNDYDISNIKSKGGIIN